MTEHTEPSRRPGVGSTDDELHRDLELTREELGRTAATLTRRLDPRRRVEETTSRYASSLQQAAIRAGHALRPVLGTPARRRTVGAGTVLLVLVLLLRRTAARR